ncbi:hypothetical protein HMI56_001216 [Coelomomyces lativittatus]|nr:hypothetical protein HMI56_001216 [Coelomomyces lativittatus]
MDEVSQEVLTQARIVEWTVGIDSALCVMGTLLNLLLIVVILWKPKTLLTYKSLHLILNLAFSDFCLSLMQLKFIIPDFWLYPEYTLVSSSAAIIFTSWCFSILVAISPFMVNLAPYYLEDQNTYCETNISDLLVKAADDSLSFNFLD